MGQLALNFIAAHQQYFLGIASGYAIAHIPWVVLIAFHAAMKIPWLRAQVVSNPAQAKAIVDAIMQELDRDIDAEAASAQPTAPAQPVKP